MQVSTRLCQAGSPPSRPPRVVLAAFGVRKSFGPYVALDGASLAIRPGEAVVVRGEPGAGKSTLLMCLANHLRADAGLVVYQGVRLGVERTSGGPALLTGAAMLRPDLTCAENVARPLRRMGLRRRAARRVATAWLDRLGAPGCGRRYPGELSCGQSHRVAAATVLATAPRVVLADDPAELMDRGEALDVTRSVLEAARAVGAALVLAARDASVAADADRQVLLREGRVVGGREIPGW
ncbi:ATP-binding cassette domain-containing protein [Streptantibioticus cattleyicolor]|uniref:ABC transporter ATP-binding protein n=1 Tax=Streptantibioticus cattleyicolor (strain ATCC 35852 / DSM 46488 / JCM 4925 / NBRC 14057 / NRRL 8057) TaxID=1003195 RepID=F8JLU2_STREN|nr:ATP-binding cassette domain-containing protein [Streptantibioticus cattleyicolor]AEW99472.1 ABC transporter ATP-binding protein [Streptantibioticus cattleyicolor NRRL 8057 = DSM 46488]CCB71486.1 putative ABC transporter ATP-binding protein [Streptantibioticus cattleyicolor NRRL 8057 = DSM 46488]